MPFLDTTSITGGFNQFITDWPAGDDRIFTGAVAGLQASDPNLSDAYFTLKLNPNDTDAAAIAQKHVTQGSAPAGQISYVGTPPTASSLLIHIYSADIEPFVQPGTAYWWDFRGITVGGSTLTIATGQVVFLQQVTQTNKAGTPAALPSFGQPVIRGFLGGNPLIVFSAGGVAFAGTFNVGDVYFNSGSSGPAGWRCIQGGNPGYWIDFGAPSSGPPGPPGPAGSFTPIFPWSFGSAPPTTGQHAIGEIVWSAIPDFNNPATDTLAWICVASGTPGTWQAWPDLHFKGYDLGPPGNAAATIALTSYNVGDYIMNSAPAGGLAEGWVCVVAGAPGIWKTKGIIGD